MRAFFRVIALVLCIAVIFPVCAFAQDNYSMTLTTPPSRIDFYEGKDWSYVKGQVSPYGNFDLSGALIHYEDDDEVYDIPYYVFPWGANMWCEPVSGTWKTGANEVYIYLDDIDDVYTTSTIYIRPISKITVVQSPSYTDYIRGIDWDYDSNGNITVDTVKLDGLQIDVFYSDGTDEVIAYNKKKANISWAVTSDTFKFALGKNELNALYNNKKAKFSLNIELETMTNAYVSTEPDKYSYSFGDEWKYRRGRVYTDEVDLTGLVVTAEYNNGSTRNFAYNDEPELFSIDDVQNYTAGDSFATLKFNSEYPMYVHLWFEMIGDVNFDGGINSTDALCVLKHVVGTSVLDESEIRYADVNDDGRITSSDALEILSRSVGLISLFEAEI